MSGPELAARFLLPSTWAYFNVKRGRKVTPEPDLSRRAASLPPEAPAAPAPEPQGGGAPAPAGPAQSARSGGTSPE